MALKSFYQPSQYILVTLSVNKSSPNEVVCFVVIQQTLNKFIGLMSGTISAPKLENILTRRPRKNTPLFLSQYWRHRTPHRRQ